MSKKQQEPTQYGKPLPRVHTTFGAWVCGSAIVLAISVVGLPVDFALGGNDMVSAILEAMEIMSLLVLIFAVLLWRGEKKALAKLLTDRQTVHWTFDATEVQHYAAQSWQRSLRYNLFLAGLAGGLLLISVVLGFLNTQGQLDTGEFVAIVFTVIVSFIFLLSFLPALALLWWGHRRATTDVYLHRTGIIMRGRFFSLGGLFGGIHKIRYKAGDPDVLSFHIGSGRSNRVLEVPIPRGRETEAAHLARTFPRTFPFS